MDLTVQVYVCALAKDMQIPAVLEYFRQQLQQTTTPNLVRYLKIAYRQLDCKEFYMPVANILAKRIGRHEDWVQMFALATDMMMVVLKSTDLDVTHLDNIEDAVEEYVAAREKHFGKPIAPKHAAQIRALGKHLNTLKQHLFLIDRAIVTYGSRVQLIRADNYREPMSPLKAQREMRHDFFKGIRSKTSDNSLFIDRYAFLTAVDADARVLSMPSLPASISPSSSQSDASSVQSNVHLSPPSPPLAIPKMKSAASSIGALSLTDSAISSIHSLRKASETE
jgi:hypothetical protein